MKKYNDDSNDIFYFQVTISQPGDLNMIVPVFSIMIEHDEITIVNDEVDKSYKKVDDKRHEIILYESAQ